MKPMTLPFVSQTWRRQREKIVYSLSWSPYDLRGDETGAWVEQAFIVINRHVKVTRYRLIWWHTLEDRPLKVGEWNSALFRQKVYESRSDFDQPYQESQSEEVFRQTYVGRKNVGESISLVERFTGKGLDALLMELTI